MQSSRQRRHNIADASTADGLSANRSADGAARLPQESVAA